MTKLNTTAAIALATEVENRVAKALAKKSEDSIIKVKRSKEVKELDRLRKHRNSLNHKMDKIINRIRDRYGVVANTYNGRVQVQKIHAKRPLVKDIKNQIIIANHVMGIKPEKVVDYVTKQLLK